VAPGELIGRRMQELLGAELFAKNLPHIEAVLKGQTQIFEREIPTPTGIKYSLAHYLPDMVNGEVAGFFVIVHDITEISRQRAEIAEALQANRLQKDLLSIANEQLELAAQIAHLGVWIWTPDDGHLELNQPMFDIYGFDDGDSVNYDQWRNRVHRDDISFVEHALHQAMAGTGIYEPMFRAVRPNGETRYIQAAALVQRDQQQRVTRVIGINLDVTQNHTYQQSLLAAKQDAEKANEVKSRFLANMSHEIRTPLNAVLGMLQLLERSELNPRQAEYAVKAKGAARSLLALLNDILDYSKIEADKIEIDLESFALTDLLQELHVILNGNVGEKNVEILFRIDSRIPSIIVADRLRLRQVLINICGNAVKFTQDGYVLLTMALTSSSDDLANIRFAIKDTGIGIATAQQKTIFDAFSQAESSTTRHYGGTGLGLAISKRLVGLMGGDLELRSVPEQGSEFSFVLPLQMAAIDPVVSQEKLRVMIVDDNPMASDVLASMCHSLGWDVSTASNGYEALHTFSTKDIQVDAIFMDWRMPGMDGIRTSEEMINLLGADCPPIVMVTAFGEEKLKDFSLNHHASPFKALLTKPVLIDDLLRVASICKDGSGENAIVSEVSTGSTQKLLGVNVLVVEDNPLNRQVIESLLQESGAQVQLAEGGVSGVALATRRLGEFDVVLMDIQMPDIDGLEATRRIRSHVAFRELPVIAMTANTAPSDIAASLSAGMNAHIGKPVDIEEVERVVLTCLNGTDPTYFTRLDVTNASTDIDAGLEIVEPWTSIARRFNQNKKVYEVALRSFSEQVELLLSQIHSKISEQDLRKIADAFHAIKGIASTIGASRIASIASNAEVGIRSGQNHDGALTYTFNSATEIKSLLESSIEALRAQGEIVSKVENETDTDNVALPDDFFNTKLRELYILLKSSNIKAIDEAEQLLRASSTANKSWMEILFSHVSQLRFKDAAALVEAKLDKDEYAKPI